MKNLICSICLLLACTSAQAQTFSTKGFALTPYLNGSAWSVGDDSDTESGGGLSVEASYGFTELISGFVNLTGAKINPDEGDSYNLAHFDLGAQFNFRKDTDKLRPYARAALNGRAASFDMGSETMEVSGAGITLGGGIRYFLKPALALNVGLDVTAGQLNKASIGGTEIDGWEEDATSSRFNIGLSWFPGR